MKSPAQDSVGQPGASGRTHLLSSQRAFLRLGWLDLAGYPATFALQQFDQATVIIIQYFVARLVPDTPSVGNDYFTFVVIGLLVHAIMHVGLTGFGSQMDAAIQQGRLETLLVEPVSWKLLPFGMVQFEAITRTASVIAVALVAALLGADFHLAGVVPAVAILALGFFCVFAISILGAAVKILTKRSDPILMLYSLAAGLLSGVWTPIDVLPGWIQPLSYVIPQTYIISAARQLLMVDATGVPGPDPVTSTLALVLFSAVLYPVALSVYTRVLDLGRRLGILAGY